MKKKHPLISIVVPVYNSRLYIQHTLDSLDAQTYKNFEIIFIDDGSTDRTIDLLIEYKNKRNNISIYQQVNSGVSAARNKGIELSSGDFVTFLDSDDSYSSNYLEKMILRLQETNSDIVYCGYNEYYFSENKNKSKKISCLFLEGNVLKSYFQYNGYFHLSGILIRRKILLEKNISFEVGQNISEDLLFTVKLLSQLDFYCVKEHLFYYSKRVGSVMFSNWSDNKWLTDIIGRKKILTYLTKDYHKEDRSEVLELASRYVFQRELSYLIDCIKKMKYEKIKCYIKNNDMLLIECSLHKYKLNKKDINKFRIIKKNNKLIWFLYTIYYRFFRLNIKIF